MKRLITIVLSLLLIFSCAVPVFSANPKISVKAPNAVAGETIAVTVNLGANSGLGGLEFKVKYDTSYFQLVSGSAKAGSLFVASVNADTAGVISYAGVSADVVNSAGTLLTFKLKILKTGGKISVSVIDAIDGNEKDITSTVSVSNATVKCSHKNAKWTVTKKATCTEKGIETLNCSCGYTATREIKMTEHTYSKWKVTKEATETEKGLKVAECTVCGKKKEQAIPLLTTTTAAAETTTSAEVSSTEQSSETPSTSTETTETVNVAPEKDISVPKVVAITVFAVLGIEALGLLVFFLIKKNNKSK